METSFSHGAVFRAMNKEHGPIRKLQSNFGFLQIEEYDPKNIGHRAGIATHNPIDGKRYIYSVLDWVIKKVLVIYSFNFALIDFIAGARKEYPTLTDRRRMTYRRRQRL